jgi:hypothetical protein
MANRRQVTLDELRLGAVAYFLTAAALVIVGAGALLGPAHWSTADAYGVILEMASLRAWGVILTSVGLVKCVLFVFGEVARRIGSVLGGTVCLLWAGGFFSVMLLGDTDGWSAVPVWLVFAGVQLAAAAWQRW